jgi:Bax protein
MIQKKTSISLMVLLGLGLVFLTAYVQFPEQIEDTLSSRGMMPVPDFGGIENVQERKQAFLDYMYGPIEKANLDILEQRSRIRQLEQLLQEVHSLDRSDRAFLVRVCDAYKVSCQAAPQQWLPELLNRVDVVPPSLALAQAANESAWGTSRFAREGNNFFGQWCLKPGCGMVPGARAAGKRHEVKAFADPLESTRAYMRNLNTSRVYYVLRHLRYSVRQKGAYPAGLDLTGGLLSYSARGQEYVKEIRQIIRSNQLGDYDTRFWETAKQTK